MIADLNKGRYGVVLSPITPLWSGTVVSYNATTFTLVVTPTTASLGISVGLFVDAGGELVRIKTITNATTLVLARNGVSGGTGGGFAGGAALAIYNVRYPTSKYQRVKAWSVSRIANGYTDTELSGWEFSSFNKNFSDSNPAGGVLYWEIYDNKIYLYSEADYEEGVLVARSQTISPRLPPGGNGVIAFSAKNGSGINGSVIASGNDPEEGAIYIADYELLKDYSIAYTDLGASDIARSKAEQGPIPIIFPECSILDVDEEDTFDASASFATYNGWNGSARNPATIPSDGYEWIPGTDGVIVSGQYESVAIIDWTSAGFRYLKQSLHDSNFATTSWKSDRYIPVWVGVTPFTDILRCNISGGIDIGVKCDLSFRMPPVLLRHGLVCVYDLDTKEPVFLGYIWPASVEYDYEKSSMSFTAFTDLGFLKNVYSYPFKIMGKKGEPLDWNEFDMNSVPRGLYFLLRWHTNVLELGNYIVDTSPENRLEYIRDYTAGSILDQILNIGHSCFYALYGGRLGGGQFINHLLYGETILDVFPATAYGDITRNLLAENLAVPIGYELSYPRYSDARFSGFYYDNNLDFFPIIVRSPKHPCAWGVPTEVANLICQGPGYSEMLRWSGRHLGIYNTSVRYMFRAFLDIDLMAYRMADIPGTDRLVIDDYTLTYSPQATKWQLSLSGRTFGKTASSVVQPVMPAPATPPAPIPPIPVIPPTEDVDVIVIANDHQIGCSDDFLLGTPTWTNIKGGALAAATGHISCLDVAPTGEAWLCTTEGYAGANPSLNGIFYCADIRIGDWVLVKSETTIRAEVLNVGDGYIESLAVDDDGTVWIPITKGVAYPTYGNFQYYTGSGGSLGSPVLRQCVPPNVDTDAGRGYIGARQFNCRSDGTVSWVGIAGITPGYWSFGSDAYVPIWEGFPSISEVAPITNLLTTLGHVCAADGSVLHTGAAPEYPLVADSGVVYWARNADGYLMQDATVLAIPNGVFPDNGVFSTAAASGGGYTTVKSSVEIIWIARTAKAQNSKRNIAYTADGGVDGWLTKDGDWEAKIGTWIASSNVPVVKFVTIV